MLKKLIVKNIALITFAEIDFCGGLNILSGETGSGKSVILEAVNFLLGAKADKTLIRHGEEYCETTGVFEVDNEAVKQAVEDAGAEYDGELIIKRKFTADGKSDVKVNGCAVNLAMLKKITVHLVDVHGQSEHYLLLNKANQLKVIDGFDIARTNALKDKIKPLYTEYRNIEKELEGFGGVNGDARKFRLDLLNYQINEIESANICDGEEEELTVKRKKIINTEKIVNSLNEIHNGVSGEGGAEDLLAPLISAAGLISGFSKEYGELSGRLESLKYELSDIGNTALDLLSEIDGEENAEYIEERLDLIKSIKKKYGGGLAEIEGFLNSAVSERDKLINFEKLTADLQNRKADIYQKLCALYKELRLIRQKAADGFCSAVLKELKELGMPNSRLTTEFNEPTADDKDFSLNGTDGAEFMFSANSGEELKPLSKIISGGEMSRFMLSIKASSINQGGAATSIFDEIDAGLSGKIALTVSEKFAKLSKKSQLIAVTHLPQIAAMADSLFLISKTEESGKTYTKINLLSESEKISEITRLVGGFESSANAVAHAKDLIEKCKMFKKT